MVVVKPVSFLSSIFVLASLVLSKSTPPKAANKNIKNDKEEVDVSNVVFIAQMTRHGSRAPLS